MKSLLTILALMFTMMFSSASYAEWTKVGTVDGHTVYVDFESVRKHDGYVYFWDLIDLLKPLKSGVFSGKTYSQGDCKFFRYKKLSQVLHKQAMGRDVGESFSPENPEWNYPSPGTVSHIILSRVCSQ